MKYILVKRLLLSHCILVLLSLTAYSQANYYTLPGFFLYSLNSTNQVVDTAYDGSIAVALANDPDQIHPALLTTFDPNTGMKFDSKVFGFGPAHVQVANSALGSRVVVLSNEGGPNTVTIFDLSQTGILTRRASNRLQTNGIDYRSNLALSSTGGVGFVIVIGDNFDTELVAFRLDDAAVLSRFPLGGSAFETLRLKEVNGKRFVSFIRFVTGGRSLVVIDETNPAQPLEIASAPLEIIPNAMGISNTGMEFSSDGRFVFLANQFTGFSIVDIAAKKVVAKLEGRFLEKASLVERGSQRFLAVVSLSDIHSQATLLILNVTQPSSPTITNQSDSVIPPGGLEFIFSRLGSRIVLAGEAGFRVLEVPSLTVIADYPKPEPDQSLVQSIISYGKAGGILGAWGITKMVFGSILISETELLDTCIQDESNGNLLQINTTTGEYQFTNCRGLSISGTGTITRRGGFITLQQASGDRRVMVKLDTSINKATATIQLLSQGLTFTITDRNISNNTCACR
jgi:hypothetical protein